MERHFAHTQDAVLFQPPAFLGSLEEAFNGLSHIVEVFPSVRVPGNPGKEADVVAGVFPVLVVAVEDAGLERVLEVAAFVWATV